MTELGAANGTRIVPAGSILMLVRGMSLKTEFRMGIAARPLTFNQDVKALLPRIDVEPRFLAYAIKSLTPDILDLVEEAGHGTGVLPTKQLQSLEISLPPLLEQRAIASIFGAFDDKIELNRQINRTLEEMARALFKSWFVDFEPVQAKRDGQVPFGMNADIAALFPKHFEDSTLGPIPKGWKLCGLDDIATFLNGLALQKYPVGFGSALPVVKIAQLRTENTRDAELASADIPPAYVIDDGDVIFSWSGSLMVTVWCGGKGALNQHLFKVTSDRYPKWFYRQWTEYHLEDFQSIAADKATTMGHIKRHHLADAKVVVPPDDLLAAIDRVMAPMLDRFIHNKIENRTIASLRDTLLPNLLSGEIRIRDAETQIGAAL